MEILKGIGVSPGVAISTALVLDADELVIANRKVAPVDAPAELARLHAALAAAVADLATLRDATTEAAGKEIGAIFDFHIGLLKDKTLVKQIVAEIEERQASAEYATAVAMRKLAGTFARMSDRYFQERVKDVYDIEKRIIRNLDGGAAQQELSQLNQDVIVVAHDLLPSQTASLDRKHVKGFVVDVGGRTSHTAIVARGMGIPAIVGMGDVSTRVRTGDLCIVDGIRGTLIINPAPDQVAEFRQQEERQAEVAIELGGLRELPAVTQDGHTIDLQANIEFPHEIEDAIGRGASGVGLYRTEFLYLNSKSEPTEEDHYRAYAEALRRLDGRPLVLRTLDLGADKYDPNRSLTSPEPNPFLGDRSIRLCLHEMPMFKRQLRAILRATMLGDIRVMFPMISTLMELRQARMVLQDVMEELEDEGVAFRATIPVGMMVEVPSAALIAPAFAREVDFFSIGTNDLTQYTLAVDRTNEKVAGLFNPAHPAVLILIRDVIRAGARADLSVSVCGEMAGEPLYALLLLGLGLKTFSMNAPDVPEIKKIIRSTTMSHARNVARTVMGFDSERQVMHYLREETRRLVPEAF